MPDIAKCETSAPTDDLTFAHKFLWKGLELLYHKLVFRPGDTTAVHFVAVKRRFVVVEHLWNNYCAKTISYVRGLWCLPCWLLARPFIHGCRYWTIECVLGGSSCPNVWHLPIRRESLGPMKRTRKRRNTEKKGFVSMQYDKVPMIVPADRVPIVGRLILKN